MQWDPPSRARGYRLDVTAVEVPLLRRQAYVDGAWVDADSGDTFPVVNPATAETLAEVPRMGVDETRRALAAAERSLPEWRSRTAKSRAAVRRRLSERQQGLCDQYDRRDGIGD